MSLRRDRPPQGRPVVTRKCPYRLCYENVDFIPVPESPFGDPPRYLIKGHIIGSPVLKGRCPTSNMYHPFDARTEEYLREALASQIQEVREWIRGIAESTIVTSEPDPESQSLRGEQRTGREPADPQSEDWALGGRDDEDVAKDRVTYKPKIPTHVQGQEVGRFVASITEVIGHLNVAAMKSGEALSILSGMQDELQTVIACIDEASSQVIQAKGDANVVELDEYVGILATRKETAMHMSRELEEIREGINITHETGELYIGRLLG
jgi:hypothetical protein